MVSVYGTLSAGKKITVATPTSTTFTNSTSNLTGAVAFGTAGTATWTNAQVNAGTVPANRVTNTIGVSVTDLTGIIVGTYTSTMTFTATTLAE